MTKEQCEKRVLELKETFDKDFEKGLEAMISVGGLELEEAEDNYNYARSVFSALLLHYARSYDGFDVNERNVTIKVSKNSALLTRRY